MKPMLIPKNGSETGSENQKCYVFIYYCYYYLILNHQNVRVFVDFCWVMV